MRQSWHDFLAVPARAHGAQVFASVDELADSVAIYAANALVAGEGVVAVAQPEHRAALESRLEARGCDVAGALADGRYVACDAAETLEQLLHDGRPDAAAFERVVGSVLDRAAAAGNGRVRAFGDMVDLLVHDGRAAAAVALEALWNEARRQREFSLFCGYRLDVFDPRTQAAVLPHICAAHTHVLPAANYPRFARAVDRALVEELGPVESARIYRFAAREVHETRVPLAHALLLWLTEHAPEAAAGRVLAAARGHYAETAAA